jgi:hypothetical protein
MDILNFISWIRAGKYTTTAPLDAVTVVGVPNPTRGDAYLPVTVPISALQTNIGKFIGGGIVVSEWFENGVHKALIVSLQNLSINSTWTVALQQGVNLPGAISFSDGLTNTNAIIAQTGASATTAYAAGIARLYADGGYNDWYLPSLGELTMCYNSRAIINKVLTNLNLGTGFGGAAYWSSTGYSATDAYSIDFSDSINYITLKSSQEAVRAVRTHTF